MPHTFGRVGIFRMPPQVCLQLGIMKAILLAEWEANAPFKGGGTAQRSEVCAHCAKLCAARVVAPPTVAV